MMPRQKWPFLLGFLCFALCGPSQASFTFPEHWVVSGMRAYSLYVIRKKIEALGEDKIQSRELFLRVVRTNIIRLRRVRDLSLDEKRGVLFLEAREYKPKYESTLRLFTAEGELCPFEEKTSLILVEGQIPPPFDRAWTNLGKILKILGTPIKISFTKDGGRFARILNKERSTWVNLSQEVPFLSYPSKEVPPVGQVFSLRREGPMEYHFEFPPFVIKEGTGKMKRE